MDSTKRGLEVITCPAPNPKVKESEGLGMQDIITRPLPANKDYFQQGVVAFYTAYTMKWRKHSP